MLTGTSRTSSRTGYHSSGQSSAAGPNGGYANNATNAPNAPPSRAGTARGRSRSGSRPATSHGSASGGGIARSSTSRSPRRPLHRQHWDDSEDNQTNRNIAAHRWHREYFINQGEVIKDWTPRDPVKRTEFLHRFAHYRGTRDPSFSHAAAEDGWNQRAGVEAAMYNHQIHAYRRYPAGSIDTDSRTTRVAGISASVAEKDSPFLNNRPDLQAAQARVLATYRHPYTPAHSRDRGQPWSVQTAARIATSRAHATAPLAVVADPVSARQNLRPINGPGAPFPTPPRWGADAAAVERGPAPSDPVAAGVSARESVLLQYHPRVQLGQPQAYVERNPWVSAHRAAAPLYQHQQQQQQQQQQGGYDQGYEDGYQQQQQQQYQGYNQQGQGHYFQGQGQGQSYGQSQDYDQQPQRMRTQRSQQQQQQQGMSMPA